MRIRTKTILILVTLLSSFSAFAQEEFRITGKIVDAKGKPALADIYVPCGDIMFEVHSDANGIFESDYSNNCEGVLWVMSAINQKDYELPFSASNLPPEYYKKKLYKSLGKLEAGEQRRADLGTIPIQIYFGKAKFLIDKKDAEKVFKSEDGISLRIRDRKGNLISENEINEGLNEQESSINIALPYGNYKLEIKNSNFDWQILTEEITISASAPVSLKFAPQNTALMESAKFKKLLGLDQTAALRELKKRGFAFTTAEFKEKLQRGNIEAVILYLKGGMSPNTRFGYGFTPLMEAAEYPEIVEFLIKNGANVNAQTDKFTIGDGTDDEALSEATPLIIAVYLRNADVVRMMLENGALPNTVNTYGDTALRIAVINTRTEIIRLLLRFGANPLTKDRDGRTLIEVANERGHRDIAALLKDYLGK